MLAIRKINPVARAVVVIGAVMALATSVTFAALQNTATLTNNDILISDINGLLVDSDGNGTFGQTDEGFTFNADPGGNSDTKTFQLKNSTDNESPLAVNVQITGESPLPAGVDPTDVKFTFDTEDGSPVTYTWAQLTPTDGQPLTTLDQNETETVTVYVSLDGTAADGVNIEDFNFTFGDVAPVED